jgi:hypothetical protein
MKTKTAAELHVERLYHYQGFDRPERLARIFTEGTIYFSKPGDFNDPLGLSAIFQQVGTR